MAFQTLGTPVNLWNLPRGPNGAPTYSSHLIDAASEKVGFLVIAPKTGNIRKVGFRTGTVTTGATVDVRIETHDLTTGYPSGSLWATNTNGPQVIADGDDNTAFLTTLTADAAVTKGDLLWVVISNPGASFGNMNLVTLTDDGPGSANDVPGGALYTTSWAGITNGAPVVLLEYDDGTYGGMLHCWPIGTTGFTTTTFNSSSPTDVIGNLFSVPYKARVCGAWVWADFDGDCSIKLIGTDGTTALGTISVDADTPGAATGAGIHELMFSSAIELAINSTYRIVFEPGASNISIYDLTTPNANSMAQLGGGTSMYFTSAKDPTGTGDWTNTTTRRVFIAPIFDAFDDGAGIALPSPSNPVFIGAVPGVVAY